MIKKKILIVEDEPDMRAMLALELETSGYQVFQAGDGEAGFKLAEEVKPDLVISDVLMPKMDGNQLLKKLRGSDFGRGIPFMVLTARGKMKDYFETVSVDDFIEKPFDADDLLAKVERILGRLKPETSHEAPLPETPTAKPKTEKQRTRRKILLVENDLTVYPELKKAFVDYGYIVEVVNTPAKCFENIVLFHPDLIISKYILEGMRADKLVDIIRGMPHSRDIPIIVYTDIMLGEEEEGLLKARGSFFLADINAIKLLRKANDILNQ